MADTENVRQIGQAADMGRVTLFWMTATAVFLTPAIASADCTSEIQDIAQTMASIELSGGDKEKAAPLRRLFLLSLRRS